MKLATVRADNTQLYGAILEDGFVNLTPDFPQWPTLYDAISAGGFDQLLSMAEGRTATHTDFAYEMVLPNAARILCVGVNFPDRNAEYKLSLIHI